MRQDKLFKFMRVAQNFAQEFSKDQSTKVGAFFLDPDDYSILSHGYNGMPRGVDESVPERQERPLKYSFYEHAERNAIYNLVRRQLGKSIVLSTEQPSVSCARALIAVGAQAVYFPAPLVETPELNIVLTLFAETGVQVGYVFGNEIQAPPSRHISKLNQFVAHAQHIRTTLAKDPQANATLFLSPDDYTILTTGYSGMPRGADESRKERYGLPARDMWVEGSIRNAVYNAARPLLKGSTAVVTATTCVECARAVAAVGAAEAAYVEPSAELVSRWGRSFETALEMLEELGVRTIKVTQEQLEGQEASRSTCD